MRINGSSYKSYSIFSSYLLEKLGYFLMFIDICLQLSKCTMGVFYDESFLKNRDTWKKDIYFDFPNNFFVTFF